MPSQKRILVCPLNWGLGHATRCIPVIDELIRQGAEVLIASDGEALALLQKEYPDLKFASLPSYNIRYGRGSMIRTMASQLPSILNAIRLEAKAIGRLVSEYSVDGIISDNRYGCRVKDIRSVFLSHQLNVRIPLQWLQGVVRDVQFRMIRQFDECWVPDFGGEPNLSGELGHGTPLRNVKYIGPLSRMEALDLPGAYDVVAVLSGPEPQRTFLEEKITRQLHRSGLKALVVRGKTGEPFEKKVNGNLEVVTYLTSLELNKKMASAGMIIARSGYSTIMDLVKIGKPAILIPTPGQTEQEYLAERLAGKGWFQFAEQTDVDIERLFNSGARPEGLVFEFDGSLLKNAVQSFLE